MLPPALGAGAAFHPRDRRRDHQPEWEEGGPGRGGSTRPLRDRRRDQQPKWEEGGALEADLPPADLWARRRSPPPIIHSSCQPRPKGGPGGDPPPAARPEGSPEAP